MNDGVSYASPDKTGQHMPGETVGTGIKRLYSRYKILDNLCIKKGWLTYIKSKYTDLVFEKKDSGNNTVYYHFFNVVTETNNIANIFRREDNNVRILKPNSNVFIDADVNELPIFQKYCALSSVG